MPDLTTLFQATGASTATATGTGEAGFLLELTDALGSVQIEVDGKPKADLGEQPDAGPSDEEQSKRGALFAMPHMPQVFLQFLALAPASWGLPAAGSAEPTGAAESSQSDSGQQQVVEDPAEQLYLAPPEMLAIPRSLPLLETNPESNPEELAFALDLRKVDGLSEHAGAPRNLVAPAVKSAARLPTMVVEGPVARRVAQLIPPGRSAVAAWMNSYGFTPPKVPDNATALALPEPKFAEGAAVQALIAPKVAVSTTVPALPAPKVVESVTVPALPSPKVVEGAAVPTLASPAISPSPNVRPDVVARDAPSLPIEPDVRSGSVREEISTGEKHDPAPVRPVAVSPKTSNIAPEARAVELPQPDGPAVAPVRSSTGPAVPEHQVRVPAAEPVSASRPHSFRSPSLSLPPPTRAAVAQVEAVERATSEAQSPASPSIPVPSEPTRKQESPLQKAAPEHEAVALAPLLPQQAAAPRESSPKREERPDTPAPASEVAAVAIAKSEPAMAISLVLPSASGDTGDRVAVRMTQKGTEIHVDVHTPNSQLAQSLRQDLKPLIDGLDRAGFHTEAIVKPAPPAAPVAQLGPASRPGTPAPAPAATLASASVEPTSGPTNIRLESDAPHLEAGRENATRVELHEPAAATRNVDNAAGTAWRPAETASSPAGSGSNFQQQDSPQDQPGNAGGGGRGSGSQGGRDRGSGRREREASPEWLLELEEDRK